MQFETIPSGEFLLSEEPITTSREASESSAADSVEANLLPVGYDQPLFVVLARDPHTLFAYWDVDWPAAFGDTPPSNSKVFLRALREDRSVESTRSVEPLARHAYVEVSVPDAKYYLELGYEEPLGTWHSVMTSTGVATPADKVDENAEFQIATIPLHLSFQRLIDVFRCSQFDSNALSSAIATVQRSDELSSHAEGLPAASIPGNGAPIRPASTEVERDERAEFRAQHADSTALRQALSRAVAAQIGSGPGSRT